MKSFDNSPNYYNNLIPIIHLFLVVCLTLIRQSFIFYCEHKNTLTMSRLNRAKATSTLSEFHVDTMIGNVRMALAVSKQCVPLAIENNKSFDIA